MSTEYKLDKWGRLFFRADDVSGSLEAYKRLGASWAVVNSSCGFDASTSLDFLVDAPFVHGLELARSNKSDDGVISRLVQLKRLSVGSLNGSIDLSSLHHLEVLRARWHSKTQLPPPAAPMTDLCLWNYTPKTHDLSELPQYVSLAKLELIRGNLTSLEGLERFTQLTALDISCMTKLSDISAIARSSVTHLHFESFKSIADWSILGCSPLLASIRMSKMGEIPSLAFVKRMPALRELRFPSVSIGDGDLTPLLALDSVAFDDKRGYSHKEAEIVARIAARRSG